MDVELIKKSLWCGLLLSCLTASHEAQGRNRKGKQAARAQSAQQNPGPPPASKAPAKKPAGRKKAAAQANKPAPTPPAPPMEEADLVTAAADLQVERELEENRSLRAHFQLCDLDANGWISLREAEVILSFDRVEYRRFDANLDGRVDEPEFKLHEEELLAKLGARPPAEETAAADAPAPGEGPRSELRVAFPRPVDLLARYDADHTQGLNAAELDKLQAEMDLELSSELALAQMDADDSGQLEAGELVPIAWMASQNLPPALQPAPPASTGGTDPVGPSPAPADAAPAPPAAEVLTRTHFRLLDPSKDGWIDQSDLRLLQSPARLDVRVETVLSALDRDGDGKLSEAEFRASMSDSPPGSEGGGN